MSAALLLIPARHYNRSGYCVTSRPVSGRSERRVEDILWLDVAMSPLEPVRKMLENEPDDLFLNFALAMEYLKAGRAEEALTQLTRVRQIDPDHVPAYLQAGQALVSLGRKEEAKAMLTEGMAAAPFATTAGAVADDIVEGLRRGRHTVWSPAVLQAVFGALRFVPRPLWRRLAR